MPQILLFPDPRPLVERLGAEFFRHAPAEPGVYLMRDEQNTVLYVGKAKNLRKRLANYRVANPERLPRRHLRLLRAVRRIELETCPDESRALAREAELLLSLRPRFNRAGTWPAPPRFLLWRATEPGLELVVAPGLEPGWSGEGPLGGAAHAIRTVLVRLLWCALQPSRGLAAMPEGWFAGRRADVVLLPRLETEPAAGSTSAAHLTALFAGQPEAFVAWVRERALPQAGLFETAVREADLEALIDFCRHRRARRLG